MLPVVEGRLQLQDARRSGPRFFEPPEFRERCGQKHIRDAVDWIALDGLLCGIGRRFIATTLEVSERQRMERRKGPRIKRGQAQTALPPFDRALGFAGPTVDDTAKDIGERR